MTRGLLLPFLIWHIYSVLAFKKEVQQVFDPWRERGVCTLFLENPKHTRSKRMEIHFVLESLELPQAGEAERAEDLAQPLIRNQLYSGPSARAVARASATASSGA